MNHWDSSLIKEIHAEKEKEKSEDRDNLLLLISKRLYGEKIHYVLELIQNAEDEASKTIIFAFDENSIAVINDGRRFEEEDVKGICSVRPGRKKSKIGFFGIGFKSVFSITKTPQIISNKFNFQLEDYIYPVPKASLPENAKRYYSPHKGAIFLLPYSEGMPAPGELIEDFKRLDSKILLFLDNLQNLRFDDNINDIHWEIRKEPNKDSQVLLFDGRQEEEELRETRWKVFHRDIPVTNKDIVPEGKEEITETRLTIAFPIDDATRETVQKSGVVYCYLPTKRRTDLHFLIQADFLPIIGRENISDHLWNTWLMQELGKMAGDIINEIKDDMQLGNLLYDFIPLEDEIQDELVKQFYGELSRSLKDKEIAKTTHGWYKSIKCVIPDNDSLRGILSESDLRTLLHEEVHYIDSSLSANDQYTRAARILFELGAREIGAREIVDFLKLEAKLTSKSPAWFLNLYSYLSTVFDTTRKSFSQDFPWDWAENTKSLFEELKKARFILTDNKSLVLLEDATKPDRLICYPSNIDLSETHELFTEGEIVFLHPYFQQSTIIHRKGANAEEEEKRERVKDWFDEVGVRKYIKQAHIIRDVILPKFTTGKYLEYDDRKLYKLTNYIRTYWSAIESEINKKNFSPSVVQKIREGVKLRTFRYKDGSKINEYRSPDEIYFSKRYGKTEVMEDLFQGIEGICFLSPYYLNREKTEVKKKKRGRQRVEYTWRKFFEILGVWSSPRVVKGMQRIYIHQGEYDWIEREWSTGRHQIYGDSFSEDIEQLVEYCSKVDNPSENQGRLTILWESLEKNWEFYKERENCKSKYLWFYYSPKEKDYGTSSFLEYLRNSSWVPREKGGFYKPSEVLIDTKQNRLLLGNNASYVTLKARESFLKDLKVNIEPEPEQVIECLIAYRQDNPKPKGNQVKKMETIYRFLYDKLNGVKEPDRLDNAVQKIRGKFDEHALLYLPREDNAWWKPYKVFWQDFSDRFGLLRGYMEHPSQAIYDHSLLDFFILIGIKERPSIEDSLDVLEDLKLAGNFDQYKSFASKVYPYIESLIDQDNLEERNLDRPVFLSMNDNFLTPSQLYYSDDDELSDYFKSDVEILWLPCSWVNLGSMLTIGGFNRLSGSISVVKRFGRLTEMDGESTGELRRRLQYTMLYLKKKDIKLFEELEKRDVPQKSSKLELYETPNITLDYILTIDNSKEAIVEDIPKLAYLSREENRLYKSDMTGLFSVHVAKELSKLFTAAENDLFPFLDSIFSVMDEDELNEKLRYFGISSMEVTIDEPIGEVKIIPSEEDTEKDKQEPKVKKGKQSEEGPLLRPQPPGPGPDALNPDLVDPDEFIFDEIEEFIPFVGSDGSKNIPARTVKLREGHPGVGRPQRKPRKNPYRSDAEEIALYLVMRFEEIEGRYPDDRHQQLGIGYDVYSGTDTDEERFIEVKHFRGQLGPWELTPHQWKKNEEEKDSYYVYVVSGLREGNTPAIEVIQNPIKYLIPDPPVQKKFSSWKTA